MPWRLEVERDFSGLVFPAAACQADKKLSKAFEHNQMHFMRVDPYYFRVNSSNLDPSSSSGNAAHK
jgi:hypothetical protein